MLPHAPELAQDFAIRFVVFYFPTMPNLVGSTPICVLDFRLTLEKEGDGHDNGLAKVI